MSSSNALKKTVIIDPDTRGGVSTSIVNRGAPSRRAAAVEGDSYLARVLGKLRGDANLIYLAARLQNYSEACEAHMVSLRQAVAAGDGEAVSTVAHGLTDVTAKLGAIRLMKLSIALQMLGRRGLTERAGEALRELENEYLRFKENLISAVG